MRSTIKTVILAAAAAAVIASPALAKAKRTAPPNLPGVTQFYAQPSEGYAAQQQSGVTGFNAYDTFGQIRGEYLKDAPVHTGSTY